VYPFTFTKAVDESAALSAGASGARYVAGGTTLVDLMRETVERPGAVVDINALPYRDIDVNRSRLRVGSLVRMSDLAAHQGAREQFPVIVQALELSASAQLRNMASIGGNLLQRPRCLYFRDVSAACNRRSPGTGCSAVGGRNRTHAILGTSDTCVATHPSDLAVALTALDAAVVLRGSDGETTMPLADFYRRPGTTPDRENNLPAGSLITAIEVPVTAEARRSGYLKVRDRESYEFALTSVAVGMDVRNGVVRAARVAAGGVGTVPWRLPRVERALVGKPANVETWTAAAALAAEGSRPLSENGFKVELLRRAVERQLATVAALR
jgi:xanthine dehydrogenase YagS FAD-binding subunit